jgi:hypothetical protein
MCYAQTFDKSYLSYTRYNNYLPADRTASLHKQPPPVNNMKLSMLPPQPVQPPASPSHAALNSLLKHTVPARVEKK